MALKSVSMDLGDGLSFDKNKLKGTKLNLQRGALGTMLDTKSAVPQLNGGAESFDFGTTASKQMNAAKNATSANPTSNLPAPANLAQSTASPSYQPTSTATEFYRKDGDFYTKDGKYIGPTAFGTGAGFKEISAPQQAPTAMVPQPGPLLPTAKKDISAAIVSPKTPTAPSSIPQTISPTVDTGQQDQLAALRDMVAKGYQPTAQESSLQDQLTQLEGATKMGLSGMEGQGRGLTLNLVRGQQAKLTEQANIEAQTLIGQLTNLQNERLAQQQASMTQLGYAQADIDRAAEQAQQETQNQISLISSGFVPFASEGEVPEGALTYNIGGQSYYVQPVKEEAATNDIAEYQFAQQQGYQGDFFQFIREKQSASASSSPMTVGAGQTVYDPVTGQVLFQGQSSGLLDAPTVKTIGDQTVQWDATSGQWIPIEFDAIPDASKINKAADVIKAINALEQMPGMSSAVGAKGFSSLFGLKSEPIAGTAAADFLAQMNALKSLLTIENMGIMKGVLSDADIRILTQAATSLDPSLSEDQFKAEIGRIRDKMQGVLNSAGIGQPQSDQATIQNLQNLVNTGQITQQEYNDYISESQGFNNDQSKSLKGSSVLDLGPITGFGSDYWEHGLDIDLQKGDLVPSPASGTVEFVGDNKTGFGNQVKIRTANGNSVWLSHLDGFNVRQGDRVTKGQVIGAGGNTGNVIPGKGGDGSHLDLTVKKADGTYYTPKEVEQILKRIA